MLNYQSPPAQRQFPLGWHLLLSLILTAAPIPVVRLSRPIIIDHLKWPEGTWLFIAFALMFSITLLSLLVTGIYSIRVRRFARKAPALWLLVILSWFLLLINAYYMVMSLYIFGILIGFIRFP